VLPSLRAIITNPNVVKVGHNIRKSILAIASAFKLDDIKNIATSHASPLLDLGKFAKLKGVVTDANASLSDIAGAALERFASYEDNSEIDWNRKPDATQQHKLVTESDCIWQLYMNISARNSVGLPLRADQLQTPGQLVTFVVACKPVAEGFVVGHTGVYEAIMDFDGNRKSINISEKRTLVKLTKILVPGYIHGLHGHQTLQWIFDHGSHAVVAWSQLRSRSSTPPLAPSSIPGFSTPAPPSARAASTPANEFVVDLPRSLTNPSDDNEEEEEEEDIDMRVSVEIQSCVY
jgi:hypothetical protein